MINFARYDNNGRYTIVGSCEATSEDLLLPNTWIGEKVDPRTQYHAFGKPTAMPKKPSHHHTFDYSAKQWVDPRTEETQWALVRLERDMRYTFSSTARQFQGSTYWECL